MKKKITFLLFGFSLFCNGQTVTQTLNSGSIMSSNSSISVGEIIVNPSSNIQSSSGIIGILAQINQQNLEVNEFEIAKNIVVYPNPTTSKIFFNTSEILDAGKVKIYNNAGGLVSEKSINSDKSLDLEFLTTGIYLIEFSNKNYKTFKIIKH